MRTQSRIGFLTATLCGIASHAALAQVAIQRVAYQGQTVSYNSNSILLGALNSPYTNGLGQVGFTGAATPGGNFVWYDTGITWLNTDDTSATVSGAETTCGISDAGGFIYSPSYNGGDAVYTDNGNLLSEGQPHPALPGQFSTFNSRPVMMPDGTAYWIGGYTATSGGTTAGRVFLKCTDTTNPTTITKILQTGDIVDGLAVSSTGLGFAFDVSDNNAHTMITALVGTVTASDGRMLVDGVSVATEGQPTPAGGENWSSTFVTNPSINNSGNYIFTGDTTGATTSDQVMVYNGSIVLREGMTVDGITLGSATNAASINNLGKVAFIWTAAAPTTKVLFFGDASNPGAATRLLAVGDLVDYTGDNVADATLTDFKASTAVSLGLSLSDHNYVYAEVGLTDLAGGPEYEAIVKVPGPNTLVTYRFDATVTLVNPGHPSFPLSLAGVTVGTQVSGRFRYDSASPSATPLGSLPFSLATRYALQKGRFRFSIGGTVLDQWNGPFNSFVWNDDAISGGPSDGLIHTHFAVAPNIQFQVGNLLLPTSTFANEDLPGSAVSGSYVLELSGAGGSGGVFLRTGGFALTLVPNCDPDISFDGSVNVSDLLAVITAWGACPAPPATCPADINHDNTVGVADLLAVIGAWGACP